MLTHCLLIVKRIVFIAGSFERARDHRSAAQLIIRQASALADRVRSAGRSRVADHKIQIHFCFPGFLSGSIQKGDQNEFEHQHTGRSKQNLRLFATARFLSPVSRPPVRASLCRCNAGSSCFGILTFHRNAARNPLRGNPACRGNHSFRPNNALCFLGCRCIFWNSKSHRCPAYRPHHSPGLQKNLLVKEHSLFLIFIR